MTGERINRDLKVVDDETKYNNILTGMMAAEKDPYGGPLLKTMYREWWDHLMSGVIFIFSFLLC